MRLAITPLTDRCDQTPDYPQTANTPKNRFSQEPPPHLLLWGARTSNVSPRIHRTNSQCISVGMSGFHLIYNRHQKEISKILYPKILSVSRIGNTMLVKVLLENDPNETFFIYTQRLSFFQPHATVHKTHGLTTLFAIRYRI